MVQTAERGLTGRLLGETYSYVNNAADADRVLEIIDLERADMAKLSSSPIEIEKAKIRVMVLAQARTLFPDVDGQAFRVLRLDDRDLPLSGIRNESGFRLVNADAIRHGKGMNGELVTVIFARTARDRDKLVPLVFAHADQEKKGIQLKRAIDGYCEELNGAPSESLVRGATFRLAERFVAKLQEIGSAVWDQRDKVAIIAVIAAILVGGYKGISSGMQAYNKNEEAKQVEWNLGANGRIEFVKAQLTSMKDARSSEVQGKLLDAIKLQHYSALAEALNEQPTEKKVEIATLIKNLIHYELTTTRIEKSVNHTEGPGTYQRDNGWGIRMDKPADRQEFLTNYINGILKKEFNPEVRAPLLRALEEVSSSYWRK